MNRLVTAATAVTLALTAGACMQQSSPQQLNTTNANSRIYIGALSCSAIVAPMPRPAPVTRVNGRVAMDRECARNARALPAAPERNRARNESRADRRPRAT